MHTILKRSPLRLLVLCSALLGLSDNAASGQDSGNASTVQVVATSVRVNSPTTPPPVSNGNNAWAN